MLEDDDVPSEELNALSESAMSMELEVVLNEAPSMPLLLFGCADSWLRLSLTDLLLATLLQSVLESV